MWKLLMLITLFALFYAGTWLSQVPKDKWNDTVQYARYRLKIDQPVILSERGFMQLCAGWIDSQKAIQALDTEKDALATGSMPVPKKKPKLVILDTSKHESKQDPLTAAQCEKLQAFSVQQRITTHDALNCTTDIAKATGKTCFASPAILLDNIEQQWEGLFLLKDETLIKDKLDFLSPDSPVPLPEVVTGGIAAVFTVLIFVVGKSMALLGLTSMQLFQSVLTRLRGIHQPAEKVGTRLLFENYFKHVTDLLGKRRLVLFIDDLDRCDRDYTRQVLEVSNFLSTSGALFIVIGMAPRYVLANVTLSFQETARAVHEADIRNGKTEPGHDPNAGQSWFAQHYLQKLINIEVPVPKPDASQVRALLKNVHQTSESLALSREMKEDQQLEQREQTEKRIDDWLGILGKGWRISVLIAVIGMAVWLALPGAMIQLEIKPEPKMQDNSALESKHDAENIGKDSSEKDSKRPPEDASTKINEEIFIPAPTRAESFVEWPIWASVSGIALLALLGAALFHLSRQVDQFDDQRWSWLKPLLKRLKVSLLGPESTQDTEDFIDALDIWHEWIAQKNPTPRNIKAFKNHLRYLVSRDNQPPETSREAHLVALATISYVYPKDFDKIWDTINSAAAKTDSMQILFAELGSNLTKTLEKHLKAFCRLPTQDDITFYKTMIQDIKIHHPD